MAKKITILLILALGINVLVLSTAWVHHAFVTGINPFLGFIFFVLMLMLLVPLCIFGGRQLMRYIRRDVDVSPSLLFVLGAFILATAYLVNQLFLANSALDIQLLPGYFEDAQSYVRILFVILFGILAAAYRFFPVLSHRSLNPTLGYIHFWITLICAYAIVYPIHHYESMAGMPRRYLDYGDPPRFHRYYFNDTMAFILLAAQALFLVNLLNSTRRTHDL